MKATINVYNLDSGEILVTNTANPDNHKTTQFNPQQNKPFKSKVDLINFAVGVLNDPDKTYIFITKLCRDDLVFVMNYFNSVLQ